jgi:hypothetical protein
LYKPDVDRINYIINKIFEAYDFKENIEYIFNIDDIDHPDFEFEIKEQDYRSPYNPYTTSLWGYYVKFLCNPIITKDLDEYKFFGKVMGTDTSVEFLHTYKFPTRWIFEDFEDELAIGRILFKL